MDATHGGPARDPRDIDEILFGDFPDVDRDKITDGDRLRTIGGRLTSFRSVVRLGVPLPPELKARIDNAEAAFLQLVEPWLEERKYTRDDAIQAAEAYTCHVISDAEAIRGSDRAKHVQFLRGSNARIEVARITTVQDLLDGNATFEDLIDLRNGLSQAPPNNAAEVTSIVADPLPTSAVKSDEAAEIASLESAKWPLPYDSKALMSCTELAEKFGVSRDALKRKLSRWRRNHDEGWQEFEGDRRNEPRIRYEVGAVIDVITEMHRE